MRVEPCHPEWIVASAIPCHPERSAARRGVEGSPCGASCKRHCWRRTGSFDYTHCVRSAQDDKLRVLYCGKRVKMHRATVLCDATGPAFSILPDCWLRARSIVSLKCRILGENRGFVAQNRRSLQKTGNPVTQRLSTAVRRAGVALEWREGSRRGRRSR